MKVVKVTNSEVTLNNLPICTHTISEPLSLNVLGKEVRLEKSRCCKECLEPYLNRYSRLCIVCDNPIIPLHQVAYGAILKTGEEKIEGYAHAKCVPCGCLEGTWGEGGLIPLQKVAEF